MRGSDVANAIVARPGSRVLDCLALLAAIFLVASHLSKPAAEPQNSTGTPEACTYTALGDVAVCVTPVKDDLDEVGR